MSAPLRPTTPPYLLGLTQGILKGEACALGKPQQHDPPVAGPGLGSLLDQIVDHPKRRRKLRLILGQGGKEPLGIPDVAGRLRREESHALNTRRNLLSQRKDILGRGTPAMNKDEDGACLRQGRPSAQHMLAFMNLHREDR